ncbi:MAG: SDR family oxidoreductase [Chromatocurvus sp.]
MNQPIDLSNAVIWITGASAGIGAALAIQLAARGSSLVLSARDVSALEHVRDDCTGKGADPGQIMVLPLDVLDFDAMTGKTAAVVERFGRIDLLLNNAGVSQRSACVDTDFDVYRKMLNINVLGPIALTKAVLPVMLRQGHGTLAVTASVAGKVGAPLRTGYCAAKHAVMGFFDALRTEVGPAGLQVVTITPGFIRTDVAKNALNAQGQATGKSDDDIEGGMSAEDCAAAIIGGFAAGTPEIAVGEGPEMALLRLKRDDPEAAFRMLEEMAVKSGAVATTDRAG